MRQIISSKVIPGKKYGRKIGFPTINLEIIMKDISPGVYAGKGTINKKIYRAGVVVGEDGKVEAHLLGYRGDAYGKIATLEIKKFIREFLKFETEEELIQQIEKDLAMC